MTIVQQWMAQIQDWILSIADAWWVHLVVMGFSAVDAFFPTVPSESIVVTLASLWSSAGTPSIVLLALAAWTGAFVGDNIAYAIGRAIGWERFRFFREGSRGHAVVRLAERGLERRALLMLMTARYIPLGRTAVNLVAGAVRYPHHQFLPRVALSTFTWAVYSCTIGALAGQWFEHNQLLGIAVALAVALVLAVVIERVITFAHRALDARAEARQAARDHQDGRGHPESPRVAVRSGEENP